jgi:hypothetical protein
MWVNKVLFDTILADNKAQADRIAAVWNTCHALQAKHDAALAQKAKDDISIDWMRHRVNALEKQNAILMQKAAGILLPVPEIVPSRPGSMTVPDFAHLPSFEDVGDEEAKRLGVSTDDFGFLQFQEDHAPSRTE